MTPALDSIMSVRLIELSRGLIVFSNVIYCTYKKYHKEYHFLSAVLAGTY